MKRRSLLTDQHLLPPAVSASGAPGKDDLSLLSGTALHKSEDFPEGVSELCGDPQPETSVPESPVFYRLWAPGL